MSLNADHSFNQADWTRKINDARPPGGLIMSNLNEKLATEQYKNVKTASQEYLSCTRHEADEETKQIAQQRKEEREKSINDCAIIYLPSANQCIYDENFLFFTNIVYTFIIPY
nr:hypothetical protein [Trebouxia sp. A1-2]